MTENDIINWLLEGDVSIQYQVYRDLFKTERSDLRNRIENEGWGYQFMALRNSDGHWGKGFYQTKWISTHYTLLDLKNLAISKQNKDIRATINNLVLNQKALDGGIHPTKTNDISDVCINGMFLNYASYFGANEKGLESIVDCLLLQQMKDGGFNCQLKRKGAVHSSLHTTISVLEGILEFEHNNYTYRLQELKKAAKESREFILEHKLYQSHRTGETIDKKMLGLFYPSRWSYDILRALDYFHFAGVRFDNRMQDAIDILLKKRRKDNTWVLKSKHPGITHFDMEIAGKPSRWNTLRAIRVLKHFNILV